MASGLKVIEAMLEEERAAMCGLRYPFRGPAGRRVCRRAIGVGHGVAEDGVAAAMSPTEIGQRPVRP